MFEDVDFEDSQQWSESIEESAAIVTEENQETELKCILFNCLGDINRNEQQFHKNGFVCSGEMVSLFNTFKLESMEKVRLFGRDYSYSSALISNTKELFNTFKKHLNMVLSENEIGDVNKYNTARKEMNELLFYIRSLLKCSWPYNDTNKWWFHANIERLFQFLKAVKVQLKNIADLPNDTINNSSSTLGNQCKNLSYRIFHCHLDIRWLHLTIAQILSSFSEAHRASPKPEGASELDSHITNLICDLLQLAINKFNKMNISDFEKTSLFTCSCVKELWLMIQIFTDKLAESGKCKTFWEYFNQIMRMVLSKNVPMLLVFTNSQISHKECKNSPIFIVLFITEIAALQGYQLNGKFVGTKNPRVKSNYSLLEVALRQSLLSSRNVPSETALRTLLPHLSLILLEWWEPRVDSVATLWEYFNKLLNTAFYIPGTAPQNLAVLSKTPSGLLKQINSRLDPKLLSERPANETSYSMFLRLLGFVLKRLTDQNLLNQSLKLKGRIYLKFSASKLASLNECGLHNFVSLFLTMAVTTELEEVGARFQLILTQFPNDLSSNHRSIILCSELALLYLYVENNLNIEDKCTSIISYMNSNVIGQNAEEFFSLMGRTVVDGLCNIFEVSQQFDLGEHVFIGSWLEKYIRNSSQTDKVCVFNMITEITSKLHILYTQRQPGQHNSTMFENLLLHVLPSVKQFSNQSLLTIQIANVASSLTLLSLYDPDTAKKHSCSFVSLFNHFVTSPLVDLKFKRYYLNLLLVQEDVMETLKKNVENYQTLIIQTWIQSCIFWDDSNCQELFNIILTLPDMIAICADPETLKNADDALAEFFKLFGEKYDQTQNVEEIQKLKSQCGQFLGDITQRTAAVLKKGPPDENIIIRMYSCIALLFFNCSPLIYTRGKNDCLFHLLMTQLLLPAALYMDKKLHPFCVSIIRKTWHLFVYGVVKLGYQLDSYIENTFKDLVVQYVKYFVNKPGDIASYSHNLPFLKLFDSCFDKNDAAFMLKKISTTYIQCKGKTSVHARAQSALTVMSEIVNSVKSEPEKLRLIINNSFVDIFEQVLFLDDINPNRRLAVNILNNVFSTPAYKQNTTNIQSDVSSAIDALVHKHLAFYSSLVWQLLIYLASKCRESVIISLPNIKSEISRVETLRGVSFDRSLRKGCEKIEEMVKDNA